jgi:hypothetical protein
MLLKVLLCFYFFIVYMLFHFVGPIQWWLNLCTLLSVYGAKITVRSGMESVNNSDDEDGIQLLTCLQVPVVIGYDFNVLKFFKSSLLFSLLRCSVFYSAGTAVGVSIQ